MLSKLLSTVFLASVLALVVNGIPAPYTPRPKLQMTTILPKAISGIYRAENSSAIHFTSDSSGLSITVLDTGEPLLVVPKSGDRGTVVSIVGMEFLLLNRSIGTSYTIIDYVIPSSLSRRVKNALQSHSPNADRKWRRLLRKLGRNTRVEKRTAIEHLITRPEVLLMKEAAIAMGTKERILGTECPAALTFYMAVLRLVKWQTQVFGREGEDEEETYVHEEPEIQNHREQCSWWGGCNQDGCDGDNWCHHRGYRADCCDSHRRCPGDAGCSGMCGNGCTCWAWACGDCCWHRGCQRHDDCCSDLSDFSWTCLALWNFRCSSYSCY